MAVDPAIRPDPDDQGMLIAPPARPVDKRSEVIAGGPGYGLTPLIGTIAVLAREHDEAQWRYGDRVFDWMMRHPAVGAAVDALVYAALANDLAVSPAVSPTPGQPPDDEAEAALSRECSDLVAYGLANLQTPVAQVAADLVRTALAYGCSLGEMVWYIPEEGDHAGELVLAAIKPKSRDTWRFAVDAFMNVRGYVSTWPGPDTWRLMPGEKFVRLTFGGHGGDPRGVSALDRVAEAWNFLVQLPREHFRFLQRFGTPTPIGKNGDEETARPEYDAAGNPIPGTEDRPEKEFLDALIRYKGGQAIVIGKDDDLFLLEPKGEGNCFKLADDMKRREIATGVLLQVRATMEAEFGSKADSEGGADVLGNLVRYLRRWIARALQSTAAYRIVAYNKGEDVARRHTPTLSLGEVEHQDTAALLTALAAVKYQTHPSQWPAIDAIVDLPVRRADAAQDVDGGALESGADQPQDDADREDDAEDGRGQAA